MLPFNAVRQFLCLILLSATGAAAATSAFQLGVNYSEWLGFPANNGAQLATDSSGAAYLLTNTLQSNVALSTVTKLTPDGQTLLWQNQLGFAASAMTVDPTAQAIDFVDHHAIDAPRCDLTQQLVKRRTVHVGSREAAVGVDLWECDPTFPTLALNVGF